MASTQQTGLSGAELRRAFSEAFQRLEEYRDTVNALNVFPVPDGDTGTNMSLTLRSGIERCPDDDGLTVGEVAKELAQGTFFGARGNSGVILFPVLQGIRRCPRGLRDLLGRPPCPSAGPGRGKRPTARWAIPAKALCSP